MLLRLSLRDFVIVPALELDFQSAFSVLTGETGAGKSILVDALQLALGSRGDAGLVREGTARAEISAEFDSPPSLAAWLSDAGFQADDVLLLRRAIDAQGKSRAWINGSAATLGQLREAADHLVDIHGQHAWQRLTQGSAKRELLDAQAGVDTAELATRFAAFKAATDALVLSQERSGEIARERERLTWQINELSKLAPAEGEWAALDAEQQRLAHAQALMDAARLALDAVADIDDSAQALTDRAVHALRSVASHDARITPVIDSLQGALAQLQDAAHTLGSYLDRTELEPRRLAELDARMSAWMGLARRYRRPPAELPALLAQWQAELQVLDAATDTTALEQALAQAESQYRLEAQRIGAARRQAALPLAAAVTRSMQALGMAGGCFEIAVEALPQPQAHGLEGVEFLVAGHAGSTPRPLTKVASGGELSRLALAIAVATLKSDGGASTLIFDEIDAGIGGAVGDTVGALLKQLGQTRQVLAVTHLPQVAACADQHFVVSKSTAAGDARFGTTSAVKPIIGAARVVEIARMLGGERTADTSLAHAQAMLKQSSKKSPTESKARSRA